MILIPTIFIFFGILGSAVPQDFASLSPCEAPDEFQYQSCWDRNYASDMSSAYFMSIPRTSGNPGTPGQPGGEGSSEVRYRGYTVRSVGFPINIPSLPPRNFEIFVGNAQLTPQRFQNMIRFNAMVNGVQSSKRVEVIAEPPLASIDRVRYSIGKTVLRISTA